MVSSHVLGVGLALISALAVSTQSLSARLGTYRGDTWGALLVVFSINAVLIVPLAAVLYYPDYGLTLVSVLAFAGAGLTGSFLGITVYYLSIERIGASRTEAIKASQPLHATILAVVLLGERATFEHLLGIVLIVVGIAFISVETARDDPDRMILRDRLSGLGFGVATAFLFGIEPIFTKYGFAEGTPVLVGLAIKATVAAVTFYAFLRLRHGSPGPSERSDTKWFVVAGLAYTVFSLTYFAALKVSPVIIVVPILQTSPLITMLLAVVFLSRLERVTLRLAGSAAVVVLGSVLVAVFG